MLLRVCYRAVREHLRIDQRCAADGPGRSAQRPEDTADAAFSDRSAHAPVRYRLKAPVQLRPVFRRGQSVRPAWCSPVRIR